MRKGIANFVCPGLVAIVVIAGCQSKLPIRTMALSHVEAANQSEILKHIPIGTDAATALSKLEANGFKCSRKTDENGEYLYGDLREPKNAFVTERWQVKLYITDEAVTSAEVGHGRIGL